MVKVIIHGQGPNLLVRVTVFYRHNLFILGYFNLFQVFKSLWEWNRPVRIRYNSRYIVFGESAKFGTKLKLHVDVLYNAPAKIIKLAFEAVALSFKLC